MMPHFVRECRCNSQSCHWTRHQKLGNSEVDIISVQNDLGRPILHLPRVVSTLEKASQISCYSNRLGIIRTLVNHSDGFQAFKITLADPLQHSANVPFSKGWETGCL